MKLVGDLLGQKDEPLLLVPLWATPRKSKMTSKDKLSDLIKKYISKILENIKTQILHSSL